MTLAEGVVVPTPSFLSHLVFYFQPLSFEILWTKTLNSTESMSFTANVPVLLLFLVIVLVVLPAPALAFGAGDIPDFAYLNDKAFRHGDIENILETLVKTVTGGGGGAGQAMGAMAAAFGGGGGILGFAKTVLKEASGGSKFSKSDVKKVYFGNWLRDYSQAMDIGGLSKLSADTLVLIVRVLGFMTFGFATEEFEVTPERLSVYLPVEHIDNPKGYAEKEGDARTYHPKLRPPVDPRELEIDERTGMKAYMATENRGWDTSTAFIRRTFRACIEYGRRARGQENADLWEAYRLLGTGLHTMEDLLAHSNWCEVALKKMGHEEVFCHVGDQVSINTPNGPAPPLVTGTFGGADFLHSLIGEAGDKLSQASVTDLSQKMNDASNDTTASSNISALKDLLSQFSIGGGDDNNNSDPEQMHQKAKAYQFNPDNIAPPEVQQQLISLLKWKDSVMRQILAKVEMIPGLESLIEQVTNALNVYVYSILAPYLGPILSQTTGVLDEGSKAVINNDDQYEVFDNPDASDPSHSLLSKDHFGLILNEPAGKIAQLVVQHSVTLIVHAWADNSDPDPVIDRILEAFHHPYYATGQSTIQNAMFEGMEKWIGSLGSEESARVIAALTKESVRDHKNKRLGSEDQDWSEPGYGVTGSGGYSQAQADRRTQSYNKQSSSGGYGDSQSHQQETYSSGGGYQSGRRYNQDDSAGDYGSPDNNNSSRRRDDQYEYQMSGHENRGNNQQGSYGEHTSRYDEGRPGIYEDNSTNYQSKRYEQEATNFEAPSYGEERRGGYDDNSKNSQSRRYEQESTSLETSSYDDTLRGAYTASSGNYQSQRYEQERTISETPSYDRSQTGAGADYSNYGRGEVEYSSRKDDLRGADDRFDRQEEHESYPRHGNNDEHREEGYEGRGDYGSGDHESHSRRHHGHHGRRDDEYPGHDSDSNSPGRATHGQRREREYSDEQRQDYGEQRSRYGGTYEGGDDTFGAERLRINEETQGSDHGRSGYGEGYGRY